MHLPPRAVGGLPQVIRAEPFTLHQKLERSGEGGPRTRQLLVLCHQQKGDVRPSSIGAAVTMEPQERVKARAEPDTGLQGPCPPKLKDRGPQTSLQKARRPPRRAPRPHGLRCSCSALPS